MTLPENATRLAANAFEPNHAYRIGDWAYGVQFHPEYTAPIMRSYIEQQRERLEAEGLDVAALLASVTETPAATQVLKNFAHRVAARVAGS